ncbi:MAG: hypothetical protein JW808_10190 [Victivallales bacterium]|nr:hypothetical protein [Victivallales bacterium]
MRLAIGALVGLVVLAGVVVDAQDVKAPEMKNPFEKQIEKIRKLKESMEELDADKDQKKIEKIEKSIDAETKKLDKELEKRKSALDKKIDKLEKTIEKTDKSKNAAKFEALEKEVDKIHEQVRQLEKFADPDFKGDEEGAEDDDAEKAGEKGKGALKDML